jgi:beta-lactamase superfamily II metal-dependent hydrolase
MNILSLPAGSGDCFVVTWGSPKRALLIDGGRSGCYSGFLRPRLEELASERVRQLELAIVTHIDEDHMEGLIKWAETDASAPVTIKEIWFNGRPQLPTAEGRIRSVQQGDALSEVLREGSWPWNERFSGKAVLAPKGRRFPSFALPGAMRVTVLAPGPDELRELATHWNREVARPRLLAEITSRKKPPAPARLEVGDWADTRWTHDDVGATNLSSIVCLLEHGGKSALFTGDADPTVVLAAWQRLEKERRSKVQLDLLKLNHHGSHKNCSPALLQRLRPGKVLVSSDGSIYGHPEKEALAYAIKHSPGVELIFNYDNEYSRPWLNKRQHLKWKFSARAGNELGVDIRL